MKQRLPGLFLAAVLACTPACATYRVTVPDSDPQVKAYEGRAMHAYLWGIWYAPEVLAADCQGEGINDVVIKRNYLHDLASVFTLGIWMPVEVRFRCQAPRGDIGPFPAPPR